MNFLYPSILFFGLCIAIPVVIHLLHFRKRKRIYFSKIAFLKSVEIQQNRYSKIKHWLTLVARILTLLFLIFAFAQPYWKRSDTLLNPNENHAVGIIIDNSFSMERATHDGRAFEQAKAMAIETLKAYSERDRFHVTSSDPGEFSGTWLTQAEALNKVLDLSLSPSASPLSIPLSLQNDILKTSQIPHQVQFVFSDFAKRSTDVEAFQFDSSIKLVPVLIPTLSTPNLAIDSVYLSAPWCLVGQSAELNVVINNHGNQDYSEIPLRLHLNGKLVSAQHLDIKSNTSLVRQFTIPILDTSPVFGEVSIEDYPVVFDDIRYFNLKGAHQMPLLEIFQDRPNPFLARLYTQDALWSLQTTTLASLNYASLADYSVIILSELNGIPTGLKTALLEALDNGAVIMVFPSDKMDDQSYNEFLASLGEIRYDSIRHQELETDVIQTSHPLWDQVFQSIPKQWMSPHIKIHFPILASPYTPLSTILSLSNGDPLLAQYTKGEGVVYLWALPLNEQASDLPNQPIIVPLLANMTLLSQNRKPWSQTIGDHKPFETRVGALGRSVPHLISLQNDQTWIPRWQSQGATLRLFLQGLPLEAGHYRIDAGSGDWLSMNYSSVESSADNYTLEELRAVLKTKGIEPAMMLEGQKEQLLSALQQRHSLWPLWKWALVIALMTMLIEIILRIDKNTLTRLKWRKKN